MRKLTKLLVVENAKQPDGLSAGGNGGGHSHCGRQECPSAPGYSPGYPRGEASEEGYAHPQAVAGRDLGRGGRGWLPRVHPTEISCRISKEPDQSGQAFSMTSCAWMVRNAAARPRRFITARPTPSGGTTSLKMASICSSSRRRRVSNRRRATSSGQA